MFTTRLLPLLLSAALLASACSSVKVSADWDHRIDFSRFRTYSWGVHEGASSREVDATLLRAVDTQLARRGLQRLESNGELVVATHLELDPGVDVATFGYDYGPRWGGLPPEVEVREVSIGSIVVDVLDAKTHELAWRGLGSTKLPADPTPEERRARIDESAEKLFRLFPRSR
jgi:hypothetical protein